MDLRRGGLFGRPNPHPRAKRGSRSRRYRTSAFVAEAAPRSQPAACRPPAARRRVVARETKDMGCVPKIREERERAGITALPVSRAARGAAATRASTWERRRRSVRPRRASFVFQPVQSVRAADSLFRFLKEGCTVGSILSPTKRTEASRSRAFGRIEANWQLWRRTARRATTAMKREEKKEKRPWASLGNTLSTFTGKN